MFYSLLASRSPWVVQYLRRPRLIVSSFWLVFFHITPLGLFVFRTAFLSDTLLLCLWTLYSPPNTSLLLCAVRFIQILVFARSYWEQSTYCEVPCRG